MGLGRRRFQCHPSCTSSLLPDQALRPTSRMTLWAAHARARQAPRRGVLAAALDSKSPVVRFRFNEFEDGLFVVADATVLLDTWTTFNWTRRMWSHNVVARKAWYSTFDFRLIFGILFWVRRRTPRRCYVGLFLKSTWLPGIRVQY